MIGRRLFPAAIVVMLYATPHGLFQSATLVKDIYPGTGPQAVPFKHSNLVRSGGLLYFTADSGGSGKELWRTDGTPAGIRVVADLTADSSSDSLPNNGVANFTDVGGVLFLDVYGYFQ